ncbi:DUF4234 domain-containing protein [Faecalibaculum rodentium]|uniref:DUF4234 domain-containing protein n=1 Tax=Faecalibaculum rodentium TaxID=1702221 RepID=UPI0023F4E92D|nr:DUF4234 domain-containing protein [Faecalibaculum rodentium]
MKCKVCGKENEAGAQVCADCGSPLEEEILEEVTQETPASSWYYVNDGQSVGPYTEAEMRGFLSSRLIDRTTYVWKTGMADWKRLEDTELAVYLRQQNSASRQSQYDQNQYQNGQGTGNTYNTYNTYNNYGSGLVPRSVRERGLLTAVLLSIVTCSIYQWYWIYSMARDINDLAAAQNKPRGCDPMVALLMSILSCGLYTIYFFWREGRVLSELDYPNYRPANDTTVLTVLALFTPLISSVILQSDINDIVRYGE